MIAIRKSAARGHFRNDWLNARHSFSFGDYYDPAHMGWSDLRVINQDIVAPGGGFPTHGHRDMEIITYVISGAVAHRDSMGNVATIGAGEIQRMSAGTGVMHSEFNPSAHEPLELLQIWLLPERAGARPGYEQMRIDAPADAGRPLTLIGSPEGGEDQVRIHQDARLYRGALTPGARVVLPIDQGRKGWLQLIRGNVGIEGQLLEAGDGAAIAALGELAISSRDGAEFLLFDLRP